MKKKSTILWLAFAVCLVITVIMWFVVNKSEVKYEEVEVTVLSSETKQYKDRKKGTTYTKYEIKVEYDGKTYDLENAHNSYQFVEGRTVKAYLANKRLFANVEGVKTSTPLATVYFVFLIGTFVIFFVAITSMGKEFQDKTLDDKKNKKKLK